MLTCREDIGDDVSHLFNSLTGYANGTDYRVLLVAPRDLRDGLSRRIEREIKQHRRSGDGRLIFKMNALTEPRPHHAAVSGEPRGRAGRSAGARDLLP